MKCTAIPAIPVVGFALVSAQGSGGDHPPVGLHGSGSTLAAPCFRRVMSKFDDQIRLQTKLTYRAVGSGTGIREFLGNVPQATDPDAFVPYTDFGAGDVPISSSDRTEALLRGIEFVQLPFALTTTSFFYNVPGLAASEPLNLTPCLLARIFSADITVWDHPDVLALNPSLSVPKDYPIYVARRTLGSSSTYTVTRYLNAQCPQSWPAENVGNSIEWHPSTHSCDGSTLIAKCLNENGGSIGYLGSASGHEVGLTELRVANADGQFLTSQEAGIQGVQQVDLSRVPSSADGDFSEVDFNNAVSAWIPVLSAWFISSTRLSALIILCYSVHSPGPMLGP